MSGEKYAWGDGLKELGRRLDENPQTKAGDEIYSPVVETYPTDEKRLDDDHEHYDGLGPEWEGVAEEEGWNDRYRGIASAIMKGRTLDETYEDTFGGRLKYFGEYVGTTQRTGQIKIYSLGDLGRLSHDELRFANSFASKSGHEIDADIKREKERLLDEGFEITVNVGDWHTRQTTYPVIDVTGTYPVVLERAAEGINPSSKSRRGFCVNIKPASKFLWEQTYPDGRVVPHGKKISGKKIFGRYTSGHEAIDFILETKPEDLI